MEWELLTYLFKSGYIMWNNKKSLYSHTYLMTELDTHLVSLDLSLNDSHVNGLRDHLEVVWVILLQWQHQKRICHPPPINLQGQPMSAWDEGKRKQGGNKQHTAVSSRLAALHFNPWQTFSIIDHNNFSRKHSAVHDSTQHKIQTRVVSTDSVFYRLPHGAVTHSPAGSQRQSCRVSWVDDAVSPQVTETCVPSSCRLDPPTSCCLCPGGAGSWWSLLASHRPNSARSRPATTGDISFISSSSSLNQTRERP